MAVRSLPPSEWLAPESAATDQAFWREWLRQAGPALSASWAVIVRPADGGQPCRVMMRAGDQRREIPDGLLDEVTADVPLCLRRGEVGGGMFALRLPWDEATSSHLVAVGEVAGDLWPAGPDQAWQDRALLWGTAAGRRRRGRELGALRRRADELAGALELAVLVRAQPTFKGAALEVCNQLAARHGADRVSLGWWREPYIRVVAVSQMNQVEARMAAVGEIEAAMEEAVEQDAALIWPEADEATGPESEGANMGGVIRVQHAALARTQGTRFLCTLVLRDGERLLGAVTWQRNDRAFSSEEAEGFALNLDAVGPWLATREREQGWWGRRWKRAAEEALRRHANLQHPWPKLAALLLAAGLAVSLLVHVPYRVEAEFTLRPVRQMVFSAPFDGFLESVAVSAGDAVPSGDELFALDAASLRLQEGELLADLSRYAREREQAEAARDLAAMRVAEAQRDQVAARLARLRRQIEQTRALAPFSGVVLDDGELRERLGAPLRQGDAVLRFAQLDGLYFELAVPEGDARLIGEGSRVEIAFRSRPDDVQEAVVTRIEPEAVVMSGGAMFIVRATPARGAAEWWRPGMTGIGKVVTEKRSLLDVFTRRLRDWLHLQLWW